MNDVFRTAQNAWQTAVVESREKQKLADVYQIDYLVAIDSSQHIRPGDQCFILERDGIRRFGFVTGEELFQSDVIHRDGLDIHEDGWVLIGNGRFIELVDVPKSNSTQGVVAWKPYVVSGNVPADRLRIHPSDEELVQDKARKIFRANQAAAAWRMVRHIYE